MSAGRPLMFETPEALRDEIGNFFTDCAERKLVPTITGLAAWLGTNRQTLLNYEGREEFVDTIKGAKAQVEAAIEQQLFSGKNAAGPIFNLKNNFGWRDQQHVEQNVTANIKTIERTVVDPTNTDS